MAKFAENDLEDIEDQIPGDFTSGGDVPHNISSEILNPEE